MKSLDAIAIECGTDKSSKGHSYCQYYDLILGPIRFKDVTILEIGIDKGDSLRMWKEYFPNGEIHGIDIRGDYEYLEDLGRIKTHIVDQSSRGELTIFGEGNNNVFDIICDDGSHQSADMILTFETLFPFMKYGGFYIIEDLLCDYDSRWNKGVSILDRIKKMISEVNMSGNIPNDHICANKKLAVTKYFGSYLDSHIEWIFQACGTVIIKKI